jgi:hypothetical protein
MGEAPVRTEEQRDAQGYGQDEPGEVTHGPLLPLLLSHDGLSEVTSRYVIPQRAGSMLRRD